MNSKDFQKQLKEAVPGVPDRFHRRVETALEQIVHQEAMMKESTKKTFRAAGRFSTRAFALALALLLTFGAVGLAATQWRVFDVFPFLFGGETPKNAESLMQGSLYQETVNNVEITVQEAGYDGRSLLLRYSFRMLDVDTPFPKELSDSDEALLYAHRVGWWIDCIWLNGKAMDMANGSQSTSHGSDVPGEIVVTDLWRLDNEGFMLGGPVEISLPIGACQSLADFKKSSHPEKYDVDGALKLPEKGMVTFTFDAKDTLSKVITLRPNVEKTLPDVTAKVTEAAFTPLMTYITLALRANPEALAAYIRENGPGLPDESGNVLYPYTGMDVFGEWIQSLELVDGNGTILFPGHFGQNGYGDEWAEFLYPYMETLPDELYLAPVRDGIADMAQAVAVKTAGQ